MNRLLKEQSVPDPQPTPEPQTTENETSKSIGEILQRKEKNKPSILMMIQALLRLLSPKYMEETTMLKEVKKELVKLLGEITLQENTIDYGYIDRTKKKRDEENREMGEFSNLYPLNAYCSRLHFFDHLNDYAGYTVHLVEIAEMFIQLFSELKPDLQREEVTKFLRSFLELFELDHDVVKNLLGKEWNELTERSEGSQQPVRFVVQNGKILQLAVSANLVLCVVSQKNNRFGVVPLFRDNSDLLADRQKRKEQLAKNFERAIQCFEGSEKRSSGSMFADVEIYKTGFGIPLEKRDLLDDILPAMKSLITTLIKKLDVQRLTKIDREVFHEDLENYLKEGKQKHSNDRKGVWLTCYSSTSQIEIGVRVDVSDDMVCLDVSVFNSLK